MRPMRRPADQQGFTLLELLIAMAIIAIGILATMAMQYSALAGYSAARDASGATEMAKTVEQVIQAEARDWEVGQDPPTSGTAVYTDMPGYFGEAMSSSGDDWERATDDPVTLRNNHGSTDSAGDDGANRYCVYLAGDHVEDNVARIAIAVVYAAPNASLGTDCPDVADIELDATEREELELDGYRSTHLSTAVQASPTD